MPIFVTCDGCGGKFSAPDDAQHKFAKCPTCGSRLEIRRRDDITDADLAQLFQVTGGAASTTAQAQRHQQPQQEQPPPPGAGSSQTKTCPFCAEIISAQAIKCKHCGSMLVPLPTQQTGNLPWTSSSERIQPSKPPKDPLLMAILSGCLIAGLGQMVLGQVKKGILILVFTVLVAFLTAFLGVFIMYPLMAVDAYSIAKKLKEGKSVGEWEWF